MDGLDVTIMALAAQGCSDRAIAREVGLSRTGVRKRRAKLQLASTLDGDGEDPWTDDGPEALALYDDVPEPVPPFGYVGMVERVPVILPGESQAPADERAPLRGR
jgi:hypothetical protein